MTHITEAPELPAGYFYRLNPNGHTLGGPRETVDICEQRSLLWFKWVKVHASAGVYRDNLIPELLGLKSIKEPVPAAAQRAFDKFMEL